MSNEVISAEQIEGLEELIAEILNRKIAQVSSNVKDIEQLKKSPAGTIIRLEEHVNAIDEKIDESRTQIAEIRTQMVTKSEFAISTIFVTGAQMWRGFGISENLHYFIR